jgi:hypothetical protein
VIFFFVLSSDVSSIALRFSLKRWCSFLIPPSELVFLTMY